MQLGLLDPSTVPCVLGAEQASKMVDVSSVACNGLINKAAAA